MRLRILLEPHTARPTRRSSRSRRRPRTAASTPSSAPTTTWASTPTTSATSRPTRGPRSPGWRCRPSGADRDARQRLDLPAARATRGRGGNGAQMSGGRAELGIGAAWYEREHQYFGIPFPSLGERFDRLEEQLAILTGLWDTKPGERFSFDGETTSSGLRRDPAAGRPAEDHHRRRGRQADADASGEVRRRVQRRARTRPARAVRQLQADLPGSVAGTRPRSGCRPRCRSASGRTPPTWRGGWSRSASRAPGCSRPGSPATPTT